MIRNVKNNVCLFTQFSNSALDAVWSENPVWETYERREIPFGRATRHRDLSLKQNRGSLQVLPWSKSSVLISTMAVSYICNLCRSFNGAFSDRKAQVLKALNRSTEAYNILQRLQVHCEKTKCTEVVIRYSSSVISRYFLKPWLTVSWSVEESEHT